MAAPPDNDLLRAVGLHHAHHGSPVLADVTLGVRAGEILAVTGPRAAWQNHTAALPLGPARP